MRETRMTLVHRRHRLLAVLPGYPYRQCVRVRPSVRAEYLAPSQGGHPLRTPIRQLLGGIPGIAPETMIS